MDSQAILLTLRDSNDCNYNDNSPFLNASTGESIDAFFAGTAAARTDSATGKIKAIRIVCGERRV